MKDSESCAHKPEGEEWEEAGEVALALNFPYILAYTLDLHI